MKLVYSIVSRRPKRVAPVNGEVEVHLPQVIACTVPDEDRQIFIGQGWHGHDPGGIVSPAHIVDHEKEHYRSFFKDGRFRFEPEPSGWFDRRCQLLDCPWFPSFVRRMAAGEVVPFREIEDAYNVHTHGERIPVGSWDELSQIWDTMMATSQ